MSIAAGAHAAPPVFTAPAPYTSMVNSPYFAADRVGVDYFLEDFEDGAANTPGLILDQSTGVITADSVDLDDALLDGVGVGRCAFNGIGSVTVTFDHVALGGYPGEVAFVWTRGGNGSTVTLFVTDGDGAPAFQQFGPIGDNSPAGSTAADRVFGVSSDRGISQITILDSAATVQIDHVQYSSPVPADVFARDFVNNDANSDLVWHKASVGNVSLWFMNGLIKQGGGAPSQAPNPNWAPQGLGDLDDDGFADIVWRDSSTNKLAATRLNAQTVVEQGLVTGAGAVPASIVVVAVADVDGDRKADIVFRNNTTGAVLVWLMDGLAKTGGGSLPGLNTTGFTFVGAGDVNGDGRSDLIWRNSTSGAISGTLMNGLTPIATQLVGGVGTIPSNWQAQAIGDLDGDGRADIVWRNLSNGAVNGWLMNGNYRKQGGAMGTIPLSWTLRAAADLSGDGKSDLVWTNSTSQQVNGWLMSGLTKLSGGIIQSLPNGWDLVNR